MPDLAFCPTCGFALTHDGDGSFHCVCGFTFNLDRSQIDDITFEMSLHTYWAGTAFIYAAYHHNQRHWKQRIEMRPGIFVEPLELIAYDRWVTAHNERLEEMADAA